MVRRDLLVAAQTEQLVTNIALKNGFSHLGRFSTDYHIFLVIQRVKH